MFLAKSFVTLKMKSKQALMKLNPSSLSAAGDFICMADFIHEVDLFHCKTDLAEKRTDFFVEICPFFPEEPNGLDATNVTISFCH